MVGFSAFKGFSILSFLYCLDVTQPVLQGERSGILHCEGVMSYGKLYLNLSRVNKKKLTMECHRLL